MRKKLRWILVCAFVVVCMLLPSFSSAADAGFTITNYDVDVVVNENKTYDVTINLTSNFTEPSRGILFSIPVRFEARRAGGDNTMVNAMIHNIDVNEEYETERDGDNLVLRIGDPDVYLTGAKDYTIRYQYDPGDDGLPNEDEFYFPIVGTEMQTSVDSVDFRIEMPKEFDKDKIGFSVGLAGSSGFNQDELSWSVDGNTITGAFAGTLNAYEGIYTRISLPQDYFVNVRQQTSPIGPFVLITSLLTGVVVILFAIFGKKQTVVQTVEFYPPAGMTPADVGLVVDGSPEDKDLISLLIYWADKGYIEIHEESKKNMVFKKLTDLPPTANDYEKLMFNRMFATGPETSTKDLQYNFYDTLATAKGRLKAKFENKETRVFTKRSQAFAEIAKVFSAFPPAAMAAFAAYNETFEGISTFFAGLLVFLFAYILSSVYTSAIYTWKSEKRSSKAGRIIVWAILTAAMYALIGLVTFELFGMFIFLGIGCALIMTLLAPFFRKRTEDGLRWYGQILGLRHFIEIVEAEKLKQMVDEDPTYFYHVLPYAYVLGISDNWAKRFESIAIQPPTWYYSSSMTMFSTVYFTSAITRSMVYSQAMMMARPSGGGSGGGPRMGGGGFSGGGFSGGFGGGGAGRW